MHQQREEMFTGISVLEAHSLFHIEVEKFLESKKSEFKNISIAIGGH